jgi:hypothetical protein
MTLTQVSSGGIKDDSIVNADIKSDAAIALSKLASTPAVLTGSTNNTITTVTGANAIQGEANLTFDGTTLKTTSKLEINASTLDAAGDPDDPDDYAIVIRNPSTDGQGNGIAFTNDDGGHVGGAIIHIDKGSNNLGDLAFYTAASSSTPEERLRIDSSGRVGIGNDSPVASTALFGGTQNCLKVAGSAAPQVRIVSDTANQADLILQAGNSGADAYIANAASNGDIVFSTHNGTSQGTRLRILDDGGICFGSDTAAANALDDYEEGTFSPTLGGQASGQSYTNQHGQYTKIGNMVTCTVHLKLAGDPGSSSNGVSVENLPYTSVTTDGSMGGAFMNYNDDWVNTSGVTGNFTAMVNSGENQCRFYKSNGDYLAWSNLDSRTAQMRCTIIYRAA